MSDIKTILFDYDGTLIDTNEIVYNAWQHTFVEITGKEGDPDLIYGTYGEPMSVCMPRIFEGIDVETALDIYRGYQKNKFKQEISLFPGIEELLANLKARGYKLGIVTSRLKASTLKGLQTNNIEHYFDVIITTEDTDKHKPHPEPLLKAIDLIESKKEECIYIGDTAYDLMCAKNAGLPSVMVGWAVAFETQKNRIGVEPDFVIEKAEDLFEIL
ncbi:MAG: HAD family hydrolase [Anaerovoracaceae bacterium]